MRPLGEGALYGVGAREDGRIMARCRGRSGPVGDVLRAAHRAGLDSACQDLRAIDAHEAKLAAEHREARDAAERSVAAEIQHLWTSLANQDKRDAADRTRVESESATALARIEEEIRALEVEVQLARAAAAVAVAEEIAALEVSIAGEDPRDAADRAQVESKTDSAIASLEADIRRLDVQVGILRKLLNWFRVRSRRSEIRRWKWWRHGELLLVDRRIDERKRRLAHMLADPAAEIESRVRPQHVRLGERRHILMDGSDVGRSSFARSRTGLARTAVVSTTSRRTRRPRSTAACGPCVNGWTRSGRSSRRRR
jgi:hypothetical protein